MKEDSIQLQRLKFFWSEFDKVSTHRELVNYSKEGSIFLTKGKNTLVFLGMTLIPFKLKFSESGHNIIWGFVFIFIVAISFMLIYLNRKTYVNDYTKERLAYAKTLYKEYEKYWDEDLSSDDKSKICEDSFLNEKYIEKGEYYYRYSKPESLFKGLDKIMYVLTPIYYIMIGIGLVLLILIVLSITV